MGRRGSWGAQRRWGFVILVIKDGVASMPGVRTGCGKLLQSL